MARGFQESATSSPLFKATTYAFNPINLGTNLGVAKSALTSLWGTPLISRTQSPRGENVDIRTSEMEDLPMGVPTRLALQSAGWRNSAQNARQARIADYDKSQAARQAAIDAQYNKTMAVLRANAAQQEPVAQQSTFGQFPLQGNMLSQNRPVESFFQRPQTPFGTNQYSMTNLPVAVAPSYRLPGGGTAQGWGDKIKQTAIAVRSAAAQRSAEDANLKQNWTDFWANSMRARQQQDLAYQQKARESAASRLEREAESMMGRRTGKYSEARSARAQQKMVEAARTRSGAFGEEAFMANIGGQTAPYRFDVASGRFIQTSPQNAAQAEQERKQASAQKIKRNEAEVGKYLASRGRRLPKPEETPWGVPQRNTWNTPLVEGPALQYPEFQRS